MFNEYNGPSLTDQEVISQLEKIQDLGWDVFVKNKLHTPKTYIIKTSDNKEIAIDFWDNEWRVAARIDGNGAYWKKPSDFDDFIRMLNEASNIIGINLNTQQINKSTRLKIKEPFSNKSRLVSLIGSRKITKIYDPYFDDKALMFLLSCHHLGVQIFSPLKCLTSKKAKNRNNIDNINDFKNEINVEVLIKIINTDNPHRRFIILDDNKVIIFGPSLNDINKDEVLIEDRSDDDLNFFEESWLSAEVII